MREKLQTLPLTQLKEIAKSQGMKGVSGICLLYTSPSPRDTR